MTSPLDSARWWLRLASGDLAGARAILKDPGAPPRLAAYLAHQAAEKALKASISAAGRQPAMSHDLVGLRVSAPDALRDSLPASALRPLAFINVLARYPSRPAEGIDRQASERHIDSAAEVVGLVATYLEGTGIDVSDLEPV